MIQNAVYMIRGCIICGLGACCGVALVRVACRARVALRVAIKKMYLYCMAMVTEVFTPAMFRAMAAKGYTQEDLCLRVGWSRRKIVDNFTMELAAAIEFLLDTPAKELWNFRKGELRALQAGRREFNRMLCSREVIAWARRFPVRELESRGLIASAAGMGVAGMGAIGHNAASAATACNSHAQRYESGLVPREVMRFMGVASIAGWQKAYAIAQDTLNPHAYSAWLRVGELQVSRPPADFEIDRGCIARNLAFLRNNAVPYRAGLRRVFVETLRKCDVAVLQVPAFLAAPAPRAACFWKGARPVLQLPTGTASDGDFMESAYSAMGHILYNRKRLSCLVTADKVISSDPARGVAAMHIAENLLLTEAEECEIICCGRFEEPRCIEYFSRAFHVRPGIIVTRLQAQRKIPAISPLNAFKIAV